MESGQVATEAPSASVRDGAWLAALVLVVLWVTWAYVASERTFYFWDYAAHQNIAAEAAAAFRQSLGSGLAYLQESYQGDYNALFALPLLPWLWAFGDSRLSFELGLALCYLVSLPLAMGALGARVVPTGAGSVFWLSAGLALLQPMTWVPTLRGFPDAGAATLIVLATVVLLEDDRLRKPRTWVKLGALLGLAVVFRRHFAYAVAAFLVSILLQAAVERLWAGRARLRAADAMGLALRTLLVGGASVATAWVVASGTARRMLEHDYSALYRSYEQPLGALLGYFAGCYGWLTLLLAGAGFVAAAFSSRVDRRRAAFVLLFALVSAAQWCLFVRQVGEQYSLHFTPAIVLGLLLLLRGLPGGVAGPRSSAVLLVLVLGASLVNLTLGLRGGEERVPKRLQVLFAGSWTPLVRQDYAEMVDLVRYLRVPPGPAQGVFLVASSLCLNPSLLREADRAVPAGGGELEMLPVPAVDSDGFYPVSELMDARLVLLARPFQHHLAQREQLVLRTVYDTFAAGVGLARDFSQAARSFKLDGCSVSVFERRRASSPSTALALLRAFEKRVPRRPGMQPDWVAIDKRFPTWRWRNPGGSTSLIAHPSARGALPATELMAIDRFAAPVSAEGTVRFEDARCQGATLSFEAMDEYGSRRVLQEVSMRPEDEGRFRARLDPRPNERLLLRLVEYAAGASIDFCLLKVDPLVLDRDPPDDVRR